MTQLSRERDDEPQPLTPTREGAGTLRLFVACELPAAWIEALRRCQNELRGRLGLGEEAQALRWVRPEGIHLTLHFLGATPAEREAEICAAMTRAAAGSSSFTLAPGGLGTFGGRRPRVVWASLEGDVATLMALHRRVVEALSAPAADERFTPHLTLARIPRPAGDPALVRPAQALAAFEAALSATAPPAAAPHRVEAIALVQSELLPGGARYTTRHVARFPANGQIDRKSSDGLRASGSRGGTIG
ncbi:MAG: RNA 2',3'-cyclic phosphodiesterase [Dehalococcoidia bacterium]